MYVSSVGAAWVHNVLTDSFPTVCQQVSSSVESVATGVQPVSDTTRSSEPGVVHRAASSGWCLTPDERRVIG